MTDKVLPKILSTAWTERVQKIETLELEFSNGEKRHYHRLHPNGFGAVMVVVLKDPDTLLLTREYCCGFHRYELGLVRGRIDADETPVQAANREMQEEIGFAAKRLDYLRTLSLAPTYMSHEIHLVLARDLYANKLEGDEPESIDIVEYPIAQLTELAMHPEFTEGRALAAILAAKAFIASDA